MEGAEATLSTRGGKLMIDRATVVKADVEASNGVIHVIDSVIVPKMQVYSLVESQSGGASAPPFLPWPESAAPRKAGEPRMPRMMNSKGSRLWVVGSDASRTRSPGIGQKHGAQEGGGDAVALRFARRGPARGRRRTAPPIDTEQPPPVHERSRGE